MTPYMTEKMTHTSGRSRRTSQHPHQRSAGMLARQQVRAPSPWTKWACLLKSCLLTNDKPHTTFHRRMHSSFQTP